MEVPTGAWPEPLIAATSRRRLLVCAATGLLSGCAELAPRAQPSGPSGQPPPPQGPRAQPPGPSGQPPPPSRAIAQLRYWDSPNLVRVERGGRAVAGVDGMPLQANDVVETQNAYAEINFSEGPIWLDVYTRVRIGSLWVFFGSIFSSVVPPFFIDTEDVTASPEGTTFGVRRDQRTGEWAVVVENGRVRCTGKRIPFQHHLRAGQILTARPGQTPRPPGPANLPNEIGWATRARGRQKPPPRVGGIVEGPTRAI
jgi:hypothetical protein